MKPLFLLADDYEPKRTLLKRVVLRNMDVEILEAGTTEEASKLIHEHVEFAAAFIDYAIPSKKGPAIIKELKEHNPNCLIALVSSGDCEAHKKDAKEVGAEAFICTSWPLDRVETELNMLLAEWKAQIEA